MPAHPPIHIVSANMRKCNAVTHALLNGNKKTHLILVQEPWFDTIGTRRNDNARNGIDVLGGVASPTWEIHYPGHANGQRPKVMAYSRKPTHAATDTYFTVVLRLDICTHPTIQVLDLIFDKEQWRVINFYHDIRDNTSLPKLLDIDIDATIPTLVIGDFNTHSRTWSPPNVPRSQWAGRLEEWAATNLLTLANNPGEITRRGAGHEKDSIIDLAWYNEAAIQAATFTGLNTDWEGSLASDHAMLRLLGRTQEKSLNQAAEMDLGFVIDPEKREEWTRAFKVRSRTPPFQASPTAEDIEDATETLMTDINRTNEEVFNRRKPPHPRASPWWNTACTIATQNLRKARTTETRGIAQARLKGTVRAAKRQWADAYIEKTQLWELAAWRHGRKVSKVPSLQGPDGLVHTHEEVADILSQRFFPQTPPRVASVFEDDPPPRPTRSLPPIDKELVNSLLARATNKSAPGQSGQTWLILKWVWAADPERLLALFAACLKAGHHPRPWKEAVVCVIPKPNRADYTHAKNFRPISLLECLGKLLEKIIAKIIYREMTKHALVPTTQFGGRNASSTLDAGLSLLHDIQAAHRTGLRTGLLLFDIQGYFDNINHERLIQVFANLGFAPELVKWCRSFLTDRTVRLRFNGRASDPFDFTVGTPQGSPVSPVLSTIYTSPLLHKMRDWTNASLGMYVDDGAIFACGRRWEDIENSIRVGYTTCMDWLTRAGLSAEPDKTELIYFRKRGEKTDPPHHMSLPLPLPNTHYRVTTTSTLRYLGFFFDNRLSWTHHVEVMCNRAQASLKALQLLGNSVRGLDQARWRLAYNAICLPVLTYGCQLWYTGKQATLVKKLQVVQNNAVRLISGTFRTTPREPLHHLLNILPMDLRLRKILLKTALRLYKAPKGSQLLIRLGGAWHTPNATDLPLPAPNRASLNTTLRSHASRIPANGPRIDPFPDLPPGAPDWNGKVKVILKQKDWDYEGVTNTLTTACREGASINIFCNGVRSNKGRLDGIQIGATSAALYQEGREQYHAERTHGESVTEQDIMLRSLHSGLDTLTSLLDTQPSQQHKPITIALTAETALLKALDASPHEDQAESIRLLNRLSTTIDKYPMTNITLIWLPKNVQFVGFRRTRQLAFEAVRTADLTNATEPPTINDQLKKAEETTITEWAERYNRGPHTSLVYRTALTSPPDGKTHHTFQLKKYPHPPTTGNTTTGPNAEGPKDTFSRLTHSTFYRFITGHAFTGEYTRRFFPLHTPEQVACQCGETVQTIEHVTMHCQLFDNARRRHLMSNGRTWSLKQLLETPKRVQLLLRFLEETRACNKPRAVWEPD